MIEDLAKLLGVLATILTPLWGITMFIQSKIAKRQTGVIVAATTAAMQSFIARQLLRCIDGRDPSTFYTLEMAFPGGESMRIPMIPGLPLQVLENIKVEVVSHNQKETIATLVCDGFGNVGMHSHPSHHESIRVIAGTMTCMSTGKLYREGDTWEVQPGEMHGAFFANCVIVIRYHPPLPTAAESPVNLDAMNSVFK